VRAALLLCVALSACVARAGTEKLKTVGDGSKHWSPPISLVRLLVDPKQYDGEFIHTIGVLRMEYEGKVVYLDRGSYDFRVSENGVRYVLSQELSRRERSVLDSMNGHYVALVGLFHAPKDGRGGGVLDLEFARELTIQR